MNTKNKCFLGIDMGGTNVKFGVVNTKGELLKKKKVATKAFASHKPFEQLVENISLFFKKHTQINHVGIGVPGMLSADRKTILQLTNVPIFQNLNLCSKLKKAFPNKHFVMDNDANVAALGEYYFGSKNLPKSFIFISMGTGIGAGLILDGKIFKGVGGNAMEAGHIMGKYNHSVEENIGKKGIVNMALEMFDRGHQTDLPREIYQDAKAISQYALEGDKLCEKVFKKAGKHLGNLIVSLVYVLDVRTIIIGGGVAKCFVHMEKHIWKSVHETLPNFYDLNIQTASLSNEAGVIGAASLCIK